MKILNLVLCLFISQTALAKISVPEVNYSQAWNTFAVTDSLTAPRQNFPFQSCFEKTAKQHQLPVALLLAMARGESDFNPNARSSANAYGLMQIVWPGTAKDLGIYSLQELKKPCVNIDAGARYIKKQIQRFDGSIHLALAAYNYGPKRISDTRANIPKGANWYSGYIYQHLQYVLGSNHKPGQYTAPLNYTDERKLDITTFNSPSRVSAFIAAIKVRAPTVRLDTFDYGMGRYHVVLLYGSQEELQASKKALEETGFAL